MMSIYLILALIVAVLLILIVLIQNPKGGGIAANFSSTNQLFGVRRTTEGVEKFTWIFASIILVLSLLTSSANGSKSSNKVEAGEETKGLFEAPVPKNSTPMSTDQQNQAPTQNTGDMPQGSPQGGGDQPAPEGPTP
jgi:preprotein translocase subunit SecG